MSIKVNLLMRFYLKIDKQTKIVNQEVKRHLYTFVNNQQDNRLEKLAIAKFVANNNKLTSTKLSLFFAIKTLHSCISLDKVELFNSSIYKRIFN